MLAVVTMAVFLGCGCAGHKRGLAAPAGSSAVWGGDQNVIVTPETAATGRVIRVNQAGRFVVLNYPLGRVPALETRLGLYRRGLKVGVARIAGPQYEDNIVADVVEGEAAPGDEARIR